MKGKILDYSFFNNSGSLITDNGDKYEFIGDTWKEQPSPKTGDIVVIGLSNSGIVDSISYHPDKRPLSAEYNPSNTKYIKEDAYKAWDWVLEGLGNFANLGGRARRKEFWYFYLANRIVMIIAFMFQSSLSSFILLLLIVPEFSVGVRRLHDVGRSGIWMLMVFIPILGWAILLYLLSKDTSPQNNKWGVPAKRENIKQLINS